MLQFIDCVKKNLSARYINLQTGDATLNINIFEDYIHT